MKHCVTITCSRDRNEILCPPFIKSLFLLLCKGDIAAESRKKNVDLFSKLNATSVTIW